jgi:hypothetical protein
MWAKEVEEDTPAVRGRPRLMDFFMGESGAGIKYEVLVEMY